MSDPVVLLSTGDVVGPAGGVTDNSMVLFSGTSGKLIKGNNAQVTSAGLALLDDVNAAAQRATLGLGTAATATLTTSATDTTAGRLVKVGDFGLGAVDTPVIANIDAFSTPSGFYKFTNGAGTKPVGGGAYAYVLINNWNGVTLNQTWISYGTPQMFVRTATDTNTWGAWQEIALINSPAFTGTPTAPTASPGTSTTQLATTAFVQASTPLSLKTSGISGSFSDLKASAPGTNATVTVTADAICLKNASNEQVVLNAVSVAPSLAASGANGLDTGASVASTWYYVWVIWNGTTASGLLSLSATSPTMPVGYTHKAMISVVRSDSTANKFPISFIQAGDDWQYKPAAGSNLVGATPLAASGIAGSVITPTYVAVSVSNYVPQIATSVDVQVSLSAANGNVLASPSAQYTTAAAVFLKLANPAATAAANSSGRRMVLESTSIYWASNASDGGLYINGFKLGL